MRSERLPRSVFLLIVAAVLLPFGALSAAGSEVCGATESPYYLLDPGEEQGIGGTGIGEQGDEGSDSRARPNVQGDDSDSGIGGTGISGDFGSFGIFGAVTQTDRLCVNGLEIQVPRGLSALMADGSASEGSLEIGMVVWVTGSSTDEGLVATQIRINPSLTGEIEALTQDGQQLVVSGYRVRFSGDVQRDPRLRDDELRTGQWIAIHGLRDSSGTWVASRIETALEGPTRYEAGALEEWLGDSAGLGFVSIEGYVQGSREKPRLGGLNLVVGPDLPTALREQLEPGARIRANGRLTGDGELVIKRAQRFRNEGWIEPAPKRTPALAPSSRFKGPERIQPEPKQTDRIVRPRVRLEPRPRVERPDRLDRPDRPSADRRRRR